MNAGILVAVLGLLAVFGEAYFANEDSFLTVAQMRAKGFQRGIPLLAHAGVWGDLIILTPLLSVLIGLHGNLWSASDIAVASAIGVVITIGMGFLWVKGAENGLPESLTHGGAMTIAGYIHAVYMAAALAIIVLFFFYSGASREAAMVVSVVLAIHVIYGTHIALGLYAPSWYPDRPHNQLVTWITVLVCWGALIWRCVTL